MFIFTLKIRKRKLTNLQCKNKLALSIITVSHDIEIVKKKKFPLPSTLLFPRTCHNQKNYDLPKSF